MVETNFIIGNLVAKIPNVVHADFSDADDSGLTFQHKNNHIYTTIKESFWQLVNIKRNKC